MECGECYRFVSKVIFADLLVLIVVLFFMLLIVFFALLQTKLTNPSKFTWIEVITPWFVGKTVAEC